MQFIDAQSFDLRSIKKTCVHIAHPDGKRLIPFDTYNMFYRDDLEQTRLQPLRDRPSLRVLHPLKPRQAPARPKIVATITKWSHFRR